MPGKKELHFLGLLSNADSSILKISLDHGIKIKNMPYSEGCNFIGQLAVMNPMAMGSELNKLACSTDSIYYVDAIMKPDITEDNFVNTFFKEISKFEKDIVKEYLIPTFQKMRLFKESNIFLPSRYYYHYINNKMPMSLQNFVTNLEISQELFSLKDSEINPLLDFIKKTQLPPSKSYINLALQNFEFSYHVCYTSLQLLLLMICLEILFNPSQGEIQYRVSRNTAVLLGKDKT